MPSPTTPYKTFMAAEHNRAGRVYVEMIPPEEFARGPGPGLLGRFGLEAVLAVRPWDLSALPQVLRGLRDTGVRTSLWPMLANEDGRWASSSNGEAFASFARQVLDIADQADHAPEHGDLFVDFEPRYAAVQQAAQGVRGLFRPPRASPRVDHERGAQALQHLVQATESSGRQVVAAVVPVVAFGLRYARLLRTPPGALAACSQIDAMGYTSMFEGWSRGTLGRSHARRLLFDVATRLVAAHGPRAALSLGTVGTGALVNEPCYRSAHELREDVAIARAAGIGTLSLFELRGVLERGRPEAWLEAFASTEPAAAPPEEGRRIRLLTRALDTFG
jgi:hypothetical protein